MIHLGDITKLRGWEVPIVDVVTGGSPCQDLSVAGKRAGLEGERSITMASLFDGIGGFPLVFERCGAKAVWASEIEEFPMAVTKARFGDD